MSHNVKLLPSGTTFTVEPGEKILRAALNAGLSLPYGCLMGTCNTCRGHIQKGDFDFGAAHPNYLPQEDRDRRLALLCQAMACGDLEIEIEELPKLPVPTRSVAIVKRIDRVSDDVIVMRVRMPLHQNLLFAAGQYVDLLLPDGERRSYSLANASALPMGVLDLELHIRHLPGGLLTDRLFSGKIAVRDKFQIEGPLGTFFLRDSDKPIVMIATGTGYAPIRSILLGMFARNDPRPCTFYWGGRTRKDLYAFDEVQAWAEQHPGFNFVPVLSRASEADGWSGRTGHVQQAVLADHPDLSAHQVYACGSPTMVSSARSVLTERGGLPDDQYFADAFVTSADSVISREDSIMTIKDA